MRAGAGQSALERWRFHGPSWEGNYLAIAAALVSRGTVAANNAIDQLAAAGVLTQTTVGRRNRAFEAPEVSDLLVDHERAVSQT